MSEQQKKRMVSDTGYEVRQSMQIGGMEILLAENMKAEDGQIYFANRFNCGDCPVNQVNGRHIIKSQYPSISQN